MTLFVYVLLRLRTVVGHLEFHTFAEILYLGMYGCCYRKTLPLCKTLNQVMNYIFYCGLSICSMKK